MKSSAPFLMARDRHCDIALSGDHEDRRGIILAVKFLQYIETGFTGNVHVEQDAGRGPASRDRQQRRAVCEADHLIAACRQNHGEGFANGRIVVDHEYFAAGGWLFGHVPSSIDSEK